MTTLKTAPGDLDRSFGLTGFVKEIIGTDNCAFIYGTAMQPDSKIVIDGSVDNNGNKSVALVRDNTDDLFDNSYGAEGKAIFFYFAMKCVRDGILIERPQDYWSRNSD